MRDMIDRAKVVLLAIAEDENEMTHERLRAAEILVANDQAEKELAVTELAVRTAP